MRRVVIITLTLMGGALGGTMWGEQAVSAVKKFQEVAEQNLDAEGFIRVHEQGTANVAVTNLPAVQDVAVTNLPAVQNVAVTNLPAVQNVTLAAPEPFTAGESIVGQVIADGQASASHSFMVPAGKRLVIEFVSAQFLLPAGQNLFVLLVETVSNGVVYRHRLIPTPLAVAGYFAVDKAVTMHADAGSTVTVRANRFPNSAGDGSFVYAVTGHLENE